MIEGVDPTGVQFGFVHLTEGVISREIDCVADTAGPGTGGGRLAIFPGSSSAAVAERGRPSFFCGGGKRFGVVGV